jgi:flagellar secretion chaperone FliS
MWNNGHDAYLESRVLSADPIELVNLLYQGGMQAVREARLHLAEGRIAERSREITKACHIVIELAVSLDHERGGEISRRLALLYDYMHRRLLEANMRQTDEPLADVLGLLTTLAEGWEGVRAAEAKPVAESAPESQPSTESTWSQPSTESSWSSQPAEQNVWSQPATQSPWSPEPAAANAWPQPETQNPWSQASAATPSAPPAAESPWSQPATESAWTQPAAESAWTQPAAGDAWSQLAAENAASPEPPADNPWAQPDSPWAQPVPQEGDYRLRAFSF